MDHQSDKNNNSSYIASEGLRPPQPSRKSSTVLLTKQLIGDIKSLISSQKGLASDATTAVNLENIENVATLVEESNTDNYLQTTKLNKYAPSERSYFPSGHNTDEEVSNNYNDEEELQEILHQLVRLDQNGDSQLNTNQHLPQIDLSALTNNSCNMKSQESFIERYITISKSSDSELFHDKLKHFFILSMAGKPIYSMNGADDVIMGYMGFITTILSTFQENLKEEIKSVYYGDDLKFVIMNKDPLIFVAITKLKYELMENDIEGEDENIIVKQLNTIYKYVLAILSKSTILKNFQNRMNYDLRKVLTPLDFRNLDALCLALTYGFSNSDSYNPFNISGFDFFLSELLDSSLQSIKITNTTRSKLNSILVSCKKIKIKENQSKQPSGFFDDISLTKNEREAYLGDDLLFAFLSTFPGKIMAMMKPKNHKLSNEDQKILFTVISSISTPSEDNHSTEDLWIPLCMPDFNPNGFLYVFVKKFDLSEFVLVDGKHIPPQPIIITLISGNKNSFFQQQEISKYIIDKITSSESFRNVLSTELLTTSKISLLKDIKVPMIKHFVFKLKRHDQCIMSDHGYYNNEKSDISIPTLLELVYYYSSLHNSKAADITNYTDLDSRKRNRKLTYVKWKVSGNVIIGFMLSDAMSEFYCLSNGLISSQDLIRYSLKIIKWCERYHKRIFVGDGAVF